MPVVCSFLWSVRIARIHFVSVKTGECHLRRKLGALHFLSVVCCKLGMTQLQRVVATSLVESMIKSVNVNKY